MTGVDAGFWVRILGVVLGPGQKVYRMWRPSTERESIALLSDRLAGKVKEEEERLQRELRAEGRSFMNVKFTAAPQPRRGNKALKSAEVGKIADYFVLPPERHRHRLVVLGKAGSGKTVAATYLVTKLLDKRWDIAEGQRAEEPVPVRVNAAGWDGRAELDRWLTTRLGIDYRLPANVAQEMVERGLILPVIDGLDEMDPDDEDRPRARALLYRLNHAPWRHRPVVVLCRSTEFERLTDISRDNGLHGATTITLQKLPTELVIDHLTSYEHDIGTRDTAWADLTNHLRDHRDGPLTEALKNPWLLDLTITTLSDRPDTAARLIACTDIDAVRGILFAAQVPAAVATTGGSEKYRDYTSDNVEKWLQSLARCLRRRRHSGRDGTAIRLDEIWEIAGSARALHAIAVGLLVGVTAGLGFGLAGWLARGLVVGLVLGLGSASMGGLIGGLVAWRSPASLPARVAWSVPGRSRWKEWLGSGLMGGLIAGFTVGPAVGLMGGLAVGLVGGLATGLMVGLRVDPEERLALVVDERRLIRDDARAAAVTAVAFGLVVGLLFGLNTGLPAGFDTGLAFGMAGGLTAGLGGGLAFGIATGRFYVAAIVFLFTKDFPKKPGLFLDWARRNGLLRVNGIAYQFRHETYQQWIHARARSGEVAAVPAADSAELR
ncbi:NACHT domain-containing protein [Nocardia sp. X0981]